MTIKEILREIPHIRYRLESDRYKDVLDEIEDILKVTFVNPQEPCGDVISRQIISDYVQSHIQEINTGYGDLNKHTNEILRMIVDYIESMPPVKPQEQKTGHWIRITNGAMKEKYICSECGRQIEDDGIEGLLSIKYPYCHCGAKMVEPQESESDV